MERKAANRHVLLTEVWQVEMSRDWFGWVFDVKFKICQMFAVPVTHRTIMGPSYANLFVGFIEEQFFKQFDGTKPELIALAQHVY